MSTVFSPNALLKMKAGETLKEDKRSGLFAIALKDNSVAWRYDRRCKTSAGGERVKRTLGAFPAHNIVQAKAWAFAIDQAIDRGENPNAEARAAKEEARQEEQRIALTVRSVWNAYIEKLEEGDKHTFETIRNKKSRMKMPLTVIGDRPISEIGHDDLQALVQAKFDEGFPSASNHLVVDLKAFFAWCIVRGRAISELTVDPSVSVHKLADDVECSRTFDMTELRLFIRALASIDHDLNKRLFTLALLSGQRIGNCLTAKASDWCPDTQAWEIKKTKNGDANVVPLAPWGASLFKDREGWLHPSVRGEGPRKGHYTYVAISILDKMRELSGDPEIAHWTTHDLRRVVSSHMARLGVDENLADRIIGHRVKGVKRVYQRWSFLPQKREALVIWENEIIRLAVEEGVAHQLGIPSAPVISIAA